MGRPKKPTRVKELQGTRERSREVANEMTLSKFEGVPEPSKKLKTLEGKGLWIKICKELYDIGLLYEVHLPLLIAYCTEYELFNKMLNRIEKEGEMFTTQAGYMQPHPAIGIKNKCILNLVKIANEFGLSPAAMTRISMPGKQKKGGLIK